MTVTPSPGDGGRRTPEPPAWLDELRLEVGPPFLAMGARSLDLARWFVVDDELDADVARKRELIADGRDLVVGHLPGSERACEEVLELIAGWRGVAPGDGGEHPLVRAALLVQDDLAVMEHRAGEWILTAGVVCFPSHWSLGDKLGMPLSLVHAPVAHYDRELRDRVERFHDRLAVERPAWRRNWSVTGTPELHLRRGVRLAPPPERIAADGSPMWIRSERQTLRRLPRTGAILFAIRIQRAPLGVLLQRPDLASRMLAAVRSWDAPKRGYSSTGGALGQLTAWLDELCRSSATAPHPTGRAPGSGLGR